MASISRTYRPQTFADITDQNPIKETLRLEVSTGKLGHAYLFAGPRGIGKTTIARVFAKALNCLQPIEGEPCNSCPVCQDINAGKSLDVIEMDAASNTGVDNVREAIVEHVRFAPQGRKHKVYILDEAHMLSTSAWNALLKTIEEPPAYAVFILVTTELHKVPATIQSRCQRFDFKRIPDASMAKRLNSLAELEGVQLDTDVVSTIVSRADGCLRDAESLLGQLLVLGEKKITSDVASLVLPVSRIPIAAALLKTWSSRQLGLGLKQINELEEQGIPLLPLFDDLLTCVRRLLLASDATDVQHALSSGDEGERNLADLVGALSPSELADASLMLMERRRDAKQGADVRFCLELACSAIALQLLPHATIKSEARSTTPPAVLRQTGTPESAPKPTPIVHIEPKQTPIKTETPSVQNATSTPPSVVSTAHVTLGQVQQKWGTFMRLMDEKSKSLTFILKISRPIEVNGPVVTIEFHYPFHKEKVVSDLKAKRLVEDCLREALQSSDIRIEGSVRAEGEEEKETRARDMVSNILRAFEGQIVESNEPPLAPSNAA